MSWRDLLQKGDESISVPWTGGVVSSGPRTWKIDGRTPPEFGWHRFSVSGRFARWQGPADPGELGHRVSGYLVGDRLVRDDARVDPDPSRIHASSETVLLLEDGLDRFTRVSAGRQSETGPLIYAELGMPMGPEDAVLGAFLDRKDSVADIPGVVPALDAAFRMESWGRADAERRRAEAARLRAEEEERLRREALRAEIVARLGDGRGRRELAIVDFEEGARAALAVGGAELIETRRSRNRDENVVRFRVGRRRFECVCDSRLHVVDAGICLTDHNTGVKGDKLFTLESLPSVIREAIDNGVLVVFRHVG